MNFKSIAIVFLSTTLLLSIENCAEAAADINQVPEKNSQGLKTTQTVIYANPDKSSVFGQQVSFYAEVFPTLLPANTPTGSVQFEVDQTPVVTQPLVNGIATFEISSLSSSRPAKNHLIRAIYSGNDQFSGSSDMLHFSVFPTNTSILIKSSENPSLFGEKVSLTVQVNSVNPGIAIPEGRVQFEINGHKIESTALDAMGRASIPLGNLESGNHLITARFLGNEKFLPSHVKLEQLVNKSDTKIQLSTQKNPSLFNEEIEFVAKVTSSIQTPSGRVQFGINGVQYDYPILLNENGEARVAIKDLDSGNHEIQVYYFGDTRFNPSQNSLNQVIHAISTQTELSSSLNPSTYGQHVRLTAQVRSNQLTPEGFVQFKIDGKTFGQPQRLLDDEETIIDVPHLKAGQHKIEANYLGETNFTPSQATLTQQVEKGNLSITVSSTTNPAFVGKPLFFIAGLDAHELIKGAIQFEIDGKAAGSPSSINRNNQAFLSIPHGLESGEHKVIATFPGNENFISSTSIPLVQIVELNIYPPRDAKGSQMTVPSDDSNVKEEQFVHVIRWKAPLTGTQPFAYRIYKDKKLTHLLATVEGDHPNPEFIDPVDIHSATTHYYIVSVDHYNHQSDAVEVEIVVVNEAQKLKKGEVKIDSTPEKQQQSRFEEKYK